MTWKHRALVNMRAIMAPGQPSAVRVVSETRCRRQPDPAGTAVLLGLLVGLYVRNKDHAQHTSAIASPRGAAMPEGNETGQANPCVSNTVIGCRERGWLHSGRGAKIRGRKMASEGCCQTYQKSKDWAKERGWKHNVHRVGNYASCVPERGQVKLALQFKSMAATEWD